MGIPRFYRFITEYFPDVSESISFAGGFKSVVDNLYLDANGILHNCAREIYFEPSSKPRLSRKLADESPKDKEDVLFEAISSYMDQLLKFVKPRKLFYIAIDGPAPLAKQAQQRQRRYKAADSKTDQELALFDTTAITPGTNFMHKLGRYLKYYIIKMMTEDPVWRKIQVIYSGADVPGEGEHKIVQYIREQSNRDDMVHCMYGLDADLFMLSLGTHCPYFYLLREDQFNTVWGDTLFYKVNIGQLRQEIYAEWASLNGDINQLIDDFIFTCFLVGNDFLHALPGCHNLSDSIVFIMDLRREKLGPKYITEGTGFNLNNLTILLTALSVTEPAAIFDQFYHQHFPNITLCSSLKDPNRPRNGINFDKYRELYYKKAGIDHTDKHRVWSFCKHYLQGLEWVQNYYHSAPKNWQWYYPFHYSPLTSDIVDYLSNAGSVGSQSKLARVSNKCFPPLLPFQQLLCVVPPRSKQLLPPYLRDIYTGRLSEYYPHAYPLDLEGKTKDWEAIAILPFIQIDQLLAEYAAATERANEKGAKTTFARNTHGQAHLYSPGSKNYNYNSEYGHVKNCKIRCT